MSLTNHSLLKYVIIVCYLTTFVLGLLGNSLVIYIIAHFDRVRIKSVTNYYIWNLAFADELFILTMPLFCYATYTRGWPFGGACCKIAYVFREINKFASVFTLVALSVDRYLATYPRLSYLRTVQVSHTVSTYSTCRSYSIYTYSTGISRTVSIRTVQVGHTVSIHIVQV